MRLTDRRSQIADQPSDGTDPRFARAGTGKTISPDSLTGIVLHP
jgi:hypothetical protein